jgi:hypothetical protein
MTRATAAGLGHVLGIAGCVAIALGLFGSGWVVLGTLWSVRCVCNWVSMAADSARGRA